MRVVLVEPPFAVRGIGGTNRQAAAAVAIITLEHHNPEPGLGREVRGRQAGNTRAHDCHRPAFIRVEGHAREGITAGEGNRPCIRERKKSCHRSHGLQGGPTRDAKGHSDLHRSR